ncbi:MAG: urate hydroxylase PuuD [Gammaproteobacteria bacterium]|nr:urate hydroxylase PuuD [Gammaproteobacteria bacterium]
MNPLLTIKGTLAVGFILALVVAFGLGNGLGGMNLVIWLHVLAGVVWIGLLYYFNFVQVPGVGKALAEANDGGPGPAAINKYVAPTALLWFRMSAAVTWLTGLSGLAQLGGGMGGIVDAFMLSGNMAVIGLGAWLGTIMLFNVWVLIWPNQKKILGLDGKEHSADAIASAKKVALLASRTNTALSIPMLLCMVGYAHGMTF